ncbi:type III pantothenate kinase [Mycoplasmopsis gallinacea]|uniref:Type III pantothenate kinase n=1 Tax=Mycoplasmopsis gallinacea TaxID=29556 RepID=A0A6H0V4Y1_9BACT|nr:type III pantothenate kinase [Mycoplasmopsis gallinacea]QIW62033.1 type III pantothenate kinase [Mycoplasmopsis gallinacea]
MKRKTIVYDVGNTYVKCGLFENKKLVKVEQIHTESFNDDSVAHLNSVFEILPEDNVVYGSVVKRVSKILKDFYSADFKNLFEINSSLKFNFSFGKIDKQKVGTDILGASYYACKEQKDSMIFLFGTAAVAIKIKDYKIKGVSIAPGIGFAFNKLLEQADGLKHLQFSYTKQIAMGTNTIDALKMGFNMLRRGFIQAHLDILKTSEKENYTRPYVSGGDIKNICKTKHKVVDNIVLKGYYQIFEDNFNL